MEKQINRKELADAVAKEFVDLKKKDVEEHSVFLNVNNVME